MGISKKHRPEPENSGEVRVGSLGLIRQLVHIKSVALCDDYLQGDWFVEKFRAACISNPGRRGLDSAVEELQGGEIRPCQQWVQAPDPSNRPHEERDHYESDADCRAGVPSTGRGIPEGSGRRRALGWTAPIGYPKPGVVYIPGCRGRVFKCQGDT